MIKNFTPNEITTQVVQYLKEAKRKELQLLLDELHPYDIANLYEMLPDKHRNRFLSFLSIAQLADILQELDKEQQQNLLNKLDAKKAVHVMDEMDNDDLVNLLEDISPENKINFLAKMKKEESQVVQDLMNYPPETAGRLMTNRYVWIPQHYTVKDVMVKLREYAEIAESINYLYVINEEKKLTGVLSYRDLILSEPNQQVKNIMFERVISVTVDTDQEHAAQIIQRYDFLAVPVVNHDHVLVGILTVDDMIDVLMKEATEDIEKLSASGKDIDFDTKAPVAAYRRLPWLILLLFIGLISGTIVSTFEETLEKVVALAFFMPMIAGMTGNTGTQSLAVVVRGLTTRDINKVVIAKIILRELLVGIIIGVTCGILISIIAYIWQGSPILGLVVGSTLVVTLIIGTLAGTIIPLILHHFKIDPAVASGPLITTLNDILSLMIYFGIATIFISHLM
ncbi:magnesium transporter [Ornithinibacillus massiliensis]|uniref:Magnesium transporter MgtE n=1 Tax=Ornithinibacillus massiliensis TaxID=1944633 RepID=A0ABS5MHN8_9BACI|nr:magnesium transporter [Ornithinibacillus massiliensis]MBS3681243.1 magnesium transporter [Ornithinibacillus massiliensis]